MMEVHAALGNQAAPPTELRGEQRSEALAERRRELTLEQVARAEEARLRSADRLAEVREAVARVVGANTRLSIARSDATFAFVYRAIDVDTGEVVQEWPQQRFIDLVRGVTNDVRTDVHAGLMLDRVA